MNTPTTTEQERAALAAGFRAGSWLRQRLSRAALASEEYTEQGEARDALEALEALLREVEIDLPGDEEPRS